MTAPADQSLGQDQARDDSMPHVFCPFCLPCAPRPVAQALCGTIAQQRGAWGYPPDLCLVCTDLWDNNVACSQCGRVPR